MSYGNLSPLGPRDVVALALALMAALAPHMQRFPLLLSLAFVGAILWRVLGAIGRLPLPDRNHRALWIAKQALAVAAFVSVYVAYRGQLGREAGVELLAALLGLKLLEMRTPRDFYVAAFLCYFLVVTNFFYSQTMITAAYMLAVVVGVTTVLIQFNTPADYRSGPRMVRLAGLMLAQALPLMMICFLLFPRLPGPLWGLPQDAFDAVSGLSEEMRVGEISRLGLSDAIAFRVQFDGTRPSPSDLYWRGPVLWHTDGQVWSTGDIGKGVPTEVEALGPSFNYTVMLEPHRMRWLLGLEMVTQAPVAGRRTSDFSLQAGRTVRRRRSYELESVVDYRITAITTEERAAALALPAGWHTRARSLAETWRSQADEPLAIVEKALNYFRANPFYYSLTPPALTNDAVDEFLFDTREGFCEHFSNAFVILMRAAGIPARIVTGYQGGEYSSIAEYLIVRQREAHAWAEIYLDGRGWTRVDPTAAVAPERVSLGFEQAMPRRSVLVNLDRDGVASQFWTHVRHSFDAVTYTWNQWVLGYSPQQQRYLLDSMGLEDWDYGDLIISLTIAVSIVTTLLGLMLVRARRQLTDPVQRAWADFSRKLGRVGLARAPAEAPQAYARRVMMARADLAREVSQITRLYTQIRYGRAATSARILSQRVRQFRPRRRR